MNLIINILYDTIYHSTPVILCVLGGIFAYKANVLNIALEGFLLFGAFSTTLFVLLYNNLFIALFLDKLIHHYPMIRGSGLPQVKGLLLMQFEYNWIRELISKFIEFNNKSIVITFIHIIFKGLASRCFPDKFSPNVAIVTVIALYLFHIG